MSEPFHQRLMRSAAEKMPSRMVHFAIRLRETFSPQPCPFDTAAVGLHKAERRGVGPLSHPAYLYGMLSAARTAAATGARSFSALEFGVAGGNGIVALQGYAEQIEREYGLKITVIGFDSGAGLLPSEEPKDCAFALPPGEFAMDEAALRRRLDRAELVLGPVEQTVGEYFAEHEIAPIGFVSIDLDVYTGSVAVLRELPKDAPRYLPRVPMYFDDLTGWPYSSAVGEWAAISEFNRIDEQRQVGQVMNLSQTLGGAARVQGWPHQFFVLHVFDHPAYNAREAQAAEEDLSLKA